MACTTWSTRSRKSRRRFEDFDGVMRLVQPVGKLTKLDAQRRNPRGDYGGHLRAKVDDIRTLRSFLCNDLASA